MVQVVAQELVLDQVVVFGMLCGGEVCQGGSRKLSTLSCHPHRVTGSKRILNDVDSGRRGPFQSSVKVKHTKC